MKVQITYKQLEELDVYIDMIVAFINCLNGTEYTKETLPTDLDGHILETSEFDYRLEVQLLFMQTEGIREWLAWYWYYDLLPELPMENVNLQESDLKNGLFMGADLQEANLQKANLEDINLWWANLQGANLEGANLSRTQLKGINLQKANLNKAKLLSAQLQSARLQEANLLGADLQNAGLQGANLEGANLNKAKLQGANIQGANLQYTDLRCAKYDKCTQFPDGFNPEESDMIYVK